MLWGMRLMRILSACVEVVAAVMLVRMNDPKAMLRLNGALGVVGPMIFIGVSALGIAASLGKIQPQKLAVILAGVILIVLGTRS